MRSSLPLGDDCTARMAVPELWWCADQAREALDKSNRRKQPSAYPAAQHGVPPRVTTAAAVQGCWDWNSIIALICIMQSSGMDSTGGDSGGGRGTAGGGGNGWPGGRGGEGFLAFVATMEAVTRHDFVSEIHLPQPAASSIHVELGACRQCLQFQSFVWSEHLYLVC